MTNEPNENQTPQEQPEANEQAQPAPEQPAPEQPAQPVQETQAPPASPGGEMGKKIQDMANRQVGGFSLCKIIALGGAALLFLSFFLPWWGFSQESKKPDGNITSDVRRAANEELSEAGRDAADYLKMFSSDALIDFGKDMAKDGKASISAYGFDMGRGIVTFIFSFLIAGAVAAVMFVKPIQQFGMFLLLLAGVLALVVFILTLTVWFFSPGDNVNNALGEIDQGVSFGTFVALLGSLGVLAGAGYEGLMGTLGFIKAQKPA
jgi:hypothetical protein